MDRDHFIIAVYCLVCQLCQTIIEALPQQRLRQGGFAPALTDEEVITIEICGEYFQLGSGKDKDIFAYFRSHYRHFFPALTDRTLFVRQAANLWQLKSVIHQRLAQISGAAEDSVQIIDTLPLPVCTYTRAGRRDHCFRPFADFGHCAAKKLDYYGFKLGLRVSSSLGIITHFALLPARPHDVHLTDDLLEDLVGGTVPADKGFIDALRQLLLHQRRAVALVTSRRKNAKTPPAVPYPCQFVRACGYLRKRVETVGAHLVERFSIARTRAHDLWHYCHRLIRKVLAHTVAVFLNLQMRS